MFEGPPKTKGEEDFREGEEIAREGVGMRAKAAQGRAGGRAIGRRELPGDKPAREEVDVTGELDKPEGEKEEEEEE